jgi:hypothetical protein
MQKQAKFFNSTEEAIAYVLSRTPGTAVPIGKSFIGLRDGLMLAVPREDGSVDVEGWISTPQKDIEKDEIEPESFSPALADYMKRGAPMSVEHGTKLLPVGFLQKAALVRNGKPFEVIDNPKHEPVQFRYPFEGGTGWYGRGNIYDQKAALGVMKGTVSSFSWIGMPKEWESLEDGGRRFNKQGAINPILETTVTAYPINTGATMRIAKAAGYVPSLSRGEIQKLLLNPLVVDAIIDILLPSGVASGVVQQTLAEAFKEELAASQQRKRYYASQKYIKPTLFGTGR